MKHRNIKIIKDGLNPETPELMAKSIVKISEVADVFMGGPLERRTIILLIYDSLGGKVSKGDIGMVLDNLPKLRSYYVKRGSV